MQISARNQFKGVVKSVELGAVNAEVTIELPGEIEIVAIITKQSAQQMGLAGGKVVHAVIKATDVMVATD